MKFVCLGYLDEKRWNNLTAGEREVLIERCFAYDDVLRGGGYWTGVGEALQLSRTARTLRCQGGALMITDGPYAETKEQIGGLGVIEARNLEHAVELMSHHPALQFGPFEIRPIDGDLTARFQSATSNAAPEGMKFVCLAYGNEAAWTVMTSAEREAQIRACLAYDEVLRKYGQSFGGVALQSPPTAKTLRSQLDTVVVTDGPYAETKELLGGVAINRFGDIDRAIKAWSKHPCLQLGDVLEIRPVDENFNARVTAREIQTAQT